MFFLVARRDTDRVGNDPDLQEMHGLGLRRIELAVPHAAARAHALDVAGADHRARAGGILVGQCAFEHVADDLHVAVAVRAEASAWRHAIFVDDAQRTEVHMFRIVVVGEREAVTRLQPPVVGMTAFATAADFFHGAPPVWSSSFAR
jgi:hypothetical protein